MSSFRLHFSLPVLLYSKTTHPFLISLFSLPLSSMFLLPLIFYNSFPFCVSGIWPQMLRRPNETFHFFCLPVYSSCSIILVYLLKLSTLFVTLHLLCSNLPCFYSFILYFSCLSSKTIRPFCYSSPSVLIFLASTLFVIFSFYPLFFWFIFHTCIGDILSILCPLFSVYFSSFSLPQFPYFFYFAKLNTFYFFFFYF